MPSSVLCLNSFFIPVLHIPLCHVFVKVAASVSSDFSASHIHLSGSFNLPWSK